MLNQQAKGVAETLVDKWFSTYGIPPRIRTNQGNSFGKKNNSAIVQIIWHGTINQHAIQPLWKFTMHIFQSHNEGFMKNTTERPKTILARSFRCSGFCIQCHATFYYWISTLPTDMNGYFSFCLISCN